METCSITNLDKKFHKPSSTLRDPLAHSLKITESEESQIESVSPLNGKPRGGSDLEEWVQQTTPHRGHRKRSYEERGTERLALVARKKATRLEVEASALEKDARIITAQIAGSVSETLAETIQTAAALQIDSIRRAVEGIRMAAHDHGDNIMESPLFHRAVALLTPTISFPEDPDNSILKMPGVYPQLLDGHPALLLRLQTLADGAISRQEALLDETSFVYQETTTAIPEHHSNDHRVAYRTNGDYPFLSPGNPASIKKLFTWRETRSRPQKAPRRIEAGHLTSTIGDENETLRLLLPRNEKIGSLIEKTALAILTQLERAPDHLERIIATLKTDHEMAKSNRLFNSSPFNPYHLHQG